MIEDHLKFETDKLRKVKIFAIVTAGLGLLSIGFSITSLVIGVGSKLKNDGVCTTEECVFAAGDILRNLDRAVNPCENFYQFSCGSWMKSNPIPELASSWTQFDILRHQLTKRIKDILEIKISTSDPRPVKLAKQFYKNCVRRNTTDERLHDLIETDMKIEDAYHQLGRKLGELRRRIGAPFIVNLQVHLDELNTSKHSVYIDQPIFGLNQIYLLSANITRRTAYRNLIEKAWILIYNHTVNAPHGNNASVNFTKIADDIIIFETKLAEISTNRDERRNRTHLYNPMTVQQLMDKSNSSMFNWKEYLSEVFKHVITIQKVQLDPLEDLEVIVRDQKYISELERVLQETDIETIVNYLRWRLIAGLGKDGSVRLREVFLEYRKNLEDTTTIQMLHSVIRAHECADDTNAFFGMAISYHFVKDRFSDNFNIQMTEMVENIRKSFYRTIEDTKWIRSENTRKKAKSKAEKMKAFVGYPHWLVSNETALDDHYNGLSLDDSDILGNVLQVAEWHINKKLAHIEEPKEMNRWKIVPTIVNAHYSTAYNSISFPAGILQPPFFFRGKSIQAINYGAVGMVIGHEIVHGFDDSGSQSDENGNLRNWWDQDTVKQYHERASCFANQYSQYQAEEVGNMTINGNLTLNENLADAGGLRQAFRAYKSFVAKYGKEQKLPGLEYTPEQLFFIAFSQIWCGSYTSQGMESQIRIGAHPPSRFRVKGVIQNSHEFANAWNCPKPNSQSSCKIW